MSVAPHQSLRAPTHLQIVTLAWPIVVSTLSHSLMTLVDTWFAGRIGPEAVGGVSLGGTAAFCALCFGVGLLRAVKVVVSQAHGSGSSGGISRVTGASIHTALLVSVPCVLAALALAYGLPSIVREAPPSFIARSYLLVRLCGTPVVLVSCALREVLYGAGDTRSPMFAALVANVAHIPLNYVLMFGLGLGVPGAAGATLVVQGLELWLLCRAQRVGGFGLRAVSINDIRALIATGAPIGLELFLGVGAFSTLVFLIANMGTAELAAHQIAIQITHITFMPTIAIGEATSVLVGNVVGAHQDQRVIGITKSALLLSCAYASACSLLLLSFPRAILELFTRDEQTMATGVSLLRIAVVLQLVDAVSVVTRSVLRGAGDIRAPALIATMAGWLMVPSLTLLFGTRFGLGAIGAWLALTAETAVVAVLLTSRLLRGNWRVAAQASRLRLSRAGR